MGVGVGTGVEVGVGTTVVSAGDDGFSEHPAMPTSANANRVSKGSAALDIGIIGCSRLLSAHVGSAGRGELVLS